jgi:hypothetical protein
VDQKIIAVERMTARVLERMQYSAVDDESAKSEIDKR